MHKIPEDVNSYSNIDSTHNFDMQLIKRGAEADIFKILWHDRSAISKVRKPKPYRNHDLDIRLRRQRTLREASMLSEVKSLGISTPLVYFVDPTQYTIIMQHIDGDTLHSLPPHEILNHCPEMGRIVGLLHAGGIMHGDLTTSNFIISDRLYLLDMGLSRRAAKPEDCAVDLRLIKEILGSAHAVILDEAWELLIKGYSGIMTDWDHILRLVSSIERRGRYANVV